MTTSRRFAFTERRTGTTSPYWREDESAFSRSMRRVRRRKGLLAGLERLVRRILWF